VRILFLSHYFPPEVNAPASRTYDHCRIWAEDGHEVAVLTNVPNHPAGKIYPGFRNRICQTSWNGKIRVHRVLTFLAPNSGVALRTLNYLFYMVMAPLVAPFLPRTDVVVSTSPQFFCGLAGYLVTRIKRARWVLEIRDIWPESIVTVGAMKKSRAIRALEWLESFAYRKADAIVSVTDSFVDHIAARGADRNKIHVIKNGVDLSLFTEPGPDAREHALKEVPGLSAVEGKFVAAYVGTHGMAHGLETVLEAAELLRAEKDIAFLLVGDGARKQELLRQRDARGLNNVIMLDQQPKSSMPLIWAATDVSLVLLKDQPLFAKVIPSKIFESMAMRRPIVLGVRGESREIIEAAGAGMGITPESAQELADAVRALRDDRERWRQMGESGQRYVKEHFDRAVLGRRMGEVLEGVLSA
jgi:glycosyltransferase involved in cell wall biosynthesis